MAGNGPDCDVVRLSGSRVCHAYGMATRITRWQYLCGSFQERANLAAIVGSRACRGILGFLQGILFTVIIPLMGPIQANERTKTIVLILILLIVGVLAGAALSFFTAFLNEQRRQRS